ncbi:MAG TPA: NAD(P)-dependent oxidoreductase [Terriglobales bacterium]|nr:NAD(P)-dependent oxidoreductase [Terriglobales bacterium]
MRRLTADLAKLGFIGLGNMGSRIANRVLDHGYQLTVYDLDPDRARAIVAKGGVVAKSILELAQTSDVILSCLTDDEAVQSVYMGSEGVFAVARPGTVVFEMSTVSPDSSRELHKLGARVGIEVMDVALSGSTSAAEEGTLTLLAGGNWELFRAAKPIFQAIAKQSHLIGGSGSGTTMKLVVNTLLGVGMQAIAEAVVLGEKAGLDRERLLEVLAKTAVVAPAYMGKLARVATNDYSPQFPLRLMHKDFQLILSTAAQEELIMPATEAAFRVNSVELPRSGEEDFSAVLRRMEEVTGIATVHFAKKAAAVAQQTFSSDSSSSSSKRSGFENVI